MKDIINKKIIISFLLFNIIPLISIILDIELSNYKNYDFFIYDYNSSNSIIFWFFSENTSSIYLTIFLIFYNLWISIFLYNISEFTRKYIILLTI